MTAPLSALHVAETIRLSMVLADAGISPRNRKGPTHET